MTDNTATELAAVRAAVAPDSAMTRLMRLLSNKQARIDASKVIKAARETSLNLDGSESPENMIVMLSLAVETLSALMNEERGLVGSQLDTVFVPWGDGSVNCKYERTSDGAWIDKVCIGGTWVDATEDVIQQDQRDKWSKYIGEAGYSVTEKTGYR